MRSRQLSDWQNALDDLQSVGQAADVVRDLEVCLFISLLLLVMRGVLNPSQLTDDFS